MMFKVDVAHRRLRISLSGPWGPDRASSFVKVKVDFPRDYPRLASPRIHVEKSASLNSEAFGRLEADLETIATNFLQSQRSSLETVVRYLIGEQNLEECLQVLQKHRPSEDISLPLDQGSSSSDEDDETMGTYLRHRGDTLDGSGVLPTAFIGQYNAPLPKACGAYWAENGTLVCFFPVKRKEPSLLDQSMDTNERSLKNRNKLSEGFGRLNDFLKNRRAPGSAAEGLDDAHSAYGDMSSSSSDSSVATDLDIGQHYFMPAMAWQASGLEAFPKVSLDESQKSSGDTGTGHSSASKPVSYISLLRFDELLPAKESLARNYRICSGHETAAYNAQVARQCGFPALGSVWDLMYLILKDHVPLSMIEHPFLKDTPLILSRNALSSLRHKDSAIDLSFDANVADDSLEIKGQVKWGGHPFGSGWLIDAL